MSIKVVPVEKGGIIKIITTDPELEGQLPKPTSKQQPDKKKAFSDPAVKYVVGFILVALLLLALIGGKSNDNDIIADVLPVAAAINKSSKNINVNINKNSNIPVIGYYYFNRDSNIIYIYEEIQK